jgi:hypothetical protein
MAAPLRGADRRWTESRRSTVRTTAYVDGRRRGRTRRAAGHDGLMAGENLIKMNTVPSSGPMDVPSGAGGRGLRRRIKQGPRKRNPRMAPVFWLVLSLQAGLMHVGNFPSLETCQAAAKTAWSSSNVVAFTCVQANTGKQGDPAPPP